MHGRDSTHKAPSPHPGGEGRPADPGTRSRTRWWGAAALGLVTADGRAVRLLPWARVFTADGVLLMADGDKYYHALRAERLAADWPHVPWFDPWMNYPDGAEIPWPPLLDQGIATASVLTGP